MDEIQDIVRIVKLSKFLALILRHQPQRFGLALDEQGWASLSEVLEILHGLPNFRWATRADVVQVVDEGSGDGKHRFELHANRIRARHGHSTPAAGPLSSNATYDRMAARYAARPVYPLTQQIDRFVELLGGGGRVLDVGCGPGQYARALADRGLSVVAVDLSGGMLAEARAASTPRLLQADMQRLPLANGAVDGCFVCASLLHLPRSQAPAALAEFHRVLRSSGILYLSLKEGAGEEWLPEAEGARFFVYYLAEELDRLVEQAAFEVVDGWTNSPGTAGQHAWLNRYARA